METRVAYAAVGLFVIVFGCALAAFGVWMSSGLTARDYDLYSIYFQESVSGLHVDAPVRYRGVVVGEVREIELTDRNPERVHVLVAIERDAPVKTDTRAKLESQGITGILNIALTGGTQAAPALVSRNGPPYPVIESEPSLFARLDEALTEGLGTLEQLSERVNAVLSPENERALSATLANLAVVTETLANNSERIERSLASAERLLESGAAASERLPATLDELRATLVAYRRLSAEVEAAADRVGSLAEAGEAGLNDVSRTTLPQANALLSQLQVLTDNMTRLAEELREEPSMLLFGRPGEPPGPGEE